MKLTQMFLTQNDCYKSGRKIKVKGIMWHSTGANNPNLRRYVGPDDGILGENKNNNHWNRPKLGVCTHAFIGKDKNGVIRTYQTLPWNMRGWHAGKGVKGSANDGYIGFEICEDGLIDEAYFNAVYQEAIDLSVYLCKQFKLTEKDIICHSEGHKMGIASNHADVMHWFPKFGKSMDTVRADVKKALEPKPIKTGKVNARAGLNVRKGPSILHGKVTAIAYNAGVKIYAEDKGWYNIGTGWVSAKYVTISGTPVPTPQRVYVVQPGDSLWKIAGKPTVYGSGLKWGQLAKLNNIKWPYTINVGQKIKY